MTVSDMVYLVAVSLTNDCQIWSTWLLFLLQMTVSDMVFMVAVSLTNLFICQRNSPSNDDEGDDDIDDSNDVGSFSNIFPEAIVHTSCCYFIFQICLLFTQITYLMTMRAGAVMTKNMKI